jgi:hypothetical protein
VLEQLLPGRRALPVFVLGGRVHRVACGPHQLSSVENPGNNWEVRQTNLGVHANFRLLGRQRLVSVGLRGAGNERSVWPGANARRCSESALQFLWLPSSALSGLRAASAFLHLIVECKLTGNLQAMLARILPIGMGSASAITCGG